MNELTQWLPFILFLILFAAGVSGEIVWLSRNGWTTAGRASGFVFAADLIGLGIGLFVVSIVFFIMFMMVMGPAGRGSNVPEWVYWVTTGFGIALPPGIMIVCRRIFLSVFKIRSGGPAWSYSVLSTILLFLLIFVPPTLVILVTSYSGLWK